MCKIRRSIYTIFKEPNSWKKQDFSILFSASESTKKGLSCGWTPFFVKTKCWEARWCAKCKRYFLILARHLQLRRHRYDVKICSLLLWWEITGEKFLLIPFLDQKLWVIQFYKVLYGIYCKFEVSNWGAVNISRMIHGRNMTLFEYLSNINILKDVKFGVRSVHRF